MTDKKRKLFRSLITPHPAHPTGRYRYPDIGRNRCSPGPPSVRKLPMVLLKTGCGYRCHRLRSRCRDQPPRHLPPISSDFLLIFECCPFIIHQNFPKKTPVSSVRPPLRSPFKTEPRIIKRGPSFDELPINLDRSASQYGYADLRNNWTWVRREFHHPGKGPPLERYRIRLIRKICGSQLEIHGVIPINFNRITAILPTQCLVAGVLLQQKFLGTSSVVQTPFHIIGVV